MTAISEESSNAKTRSRRESRFLIISDLHLGSCYCLLDALTDWLANLPPDTALILNGDVVDRVRGRLSPGDEAVLERLREESRRRTVIWVYGNHDDGFLMQQPGEIRFVREFIIDRRLYVSHGNGFDRIMPTHRLFVQVFRCMHRLRIWLGAEAIHVAAYAKRWERLYRVLRRHVMRKAVRHARYHGCAAVACGHTHFAEDTLVGGIRYINTGSWTELPVYALSVDENKIQLVKAAG